VTKKRSNQLKEAWRVGGGDGLPQMSMRLPTVKGLFE
jgi:hypothetical protein